MTIERIPAALALLLVVSACGVDGPPTPPPAEPEPRPAPTTGASITLSGEAGAGVVGGS